MRNGGIILWLSDAGTERNIGFGLNLKLISVQPASIPRGYPALIGKFDEKIRETPIVEHPKL